MATNRHIVVYTPLKQKSPIAVCVGAIPGGLPPLIGYFASFKSAGFGFEYAAISEAAIVITPFVLFVIQFLWQFPHFWAIAWFTDADYKAAGIRLLPTTKKGSFSAFMIFFSAVLMIPAGFLPMYFGFGGIIFTVISTIGGILFAWYGYKHFKEQTDISAKKVMYISIIYLPITQLVLLFDFIPFK